MSIYYIGIVGTRRRDTANDRMIVEQAFLDIRAYGDRIVSGGCPKGGDRFAEIIAKKYGVIILTCYPDWDRFGKQAGLIRNSYIAKVSNKALIACVADDRSGGTEDTIRKYIQIYGKDNLIIC